MFFRTKWSGPREYLQIVRNRREAGRVKQEVVATMGRVDLLKKSGVIDSLLRSGARFSEKLAFIDAYEKGETTPVRDTKIGIPLVFGRLWEELGIRNVIEELVHPRLFQFPVERAVFLTVLHRLMETGSDRAAEEWQEDYRVGEHLRLHHLYRAMGWLGTPLPPKEQSHATPFSPRCVKDLIEERLFERRKDLFTDLTLAFFDTTSLYFEGEGGTLGERGNSKDHRPDLPQMVVGIVLDREGRPLCSEMWPGNTADVTTLLPVAARLKERFGIGRICVVADRGMISAATVAELQKERVDYILGVRMRRQKEITTEILARAGRYHEVDETLKVKEVLHGGHRYIVCLNEEQAKKDALDREAIVAGLKERLTKGTKALIGNKGYRKYVRMDTGAVTVDEEKIAREARYDGKWVLTTNTALPSAHVARQYKQLWRVEQTFRTMKSVLRTRPIYHKKTATIQGHVFCSFLALLLMSELKGRLEKKGWKLEWDHLIHDLDHLKEVRVSAVGKDIIFRTELRGDTGKVLQAAGVAIPSTVKLVSGSKPDDA